MNAPSAVAEFGKEADASQLESADWHDVHQTADSIFHRQLESLMHDKKPSDAFYGLSPADAAQLYTDMIFATKYSGRLKTIQDLLEKLTPQQVAALMHLETARGMLETGAHVMAERNQQNAAYGTDIFDFRVRRRKITDNLRLMKKLGWDAEDVRFALSNVKIWPTLTPHPTPEKNDLGNAIFAEMTQLAESTPPEERTAHLEKIVNRMLRQRLTPSKKDTYPDETKTALHTESIYAVGMMDYLQDLQIGLDEVFGDGAIKLTDPQMHIDVAVRDWHTGDADGKQVPATMLFAKRLQSGQMAVSRNLEIINWSKDPRLDEIKEVFVKFRSGLNALARELETIQSLPSDSPEFQAYKDRFVGIFTGVSYKGQTFNNGPALTSLIMKDLTEIAHDPSYDQITRQVALRVVLRHRQIGMAMGKQELRHNSGDLNQIFENLYAWLEENQEGVLEDILDGVPLNKMNPESQTVFLRRLVERHAQDMESWILQANPEGWPREILERFRVVAQCFNQNRMGAVIIAEAEPISVVQQQVLADAFGLKNLVHVPLNESKETMEAAAANLAEYSRHFGRQSVTNRAEGENGSGAADERFLCVMTPRSDSQKAYGLFIAYTQRQSKKEIVELGLRNGFVVLEKAGSGLDPARGGISPNSMPRQNLASLPDLDGMNDEDRLVLKQAVSYVSITHQGRDLGLRLGTSAQVYDMLGGVVEEMMAAGLAIDGKVPRAHVAPVETKYDPLVSNKIRQLMEECCAEYETMRARESHGERTLGQRRIDLYLEEVSALGVAEMANVGARPGSRDEPKKSKFNQNAVAKKKVTNLRAIGSAMAIANSQTFFDNSYTLGLFLEKLHEAYKAGQIPRMELAKLWQDPFFTQQVLPNALVGLARANYEHGFDKISGEDKRWTAGRVMNAQKNKWQESGTRMGDNLAFHTVLALDAMKATALLEALARTVEGGEGATFDQALDDIMSAQYKDDATLHELNFGAKTMKRFPYIADIRRKAQNMRIVNAIKHDMERRIDNGSINMKTDTALLHHIGCGSRLAEGPANMEVLLDHVSYGTRPGNTSALEALRTPHGITREQDLAFDFMRD